MKLIDYKHVHVFANIRGNFGFRVIQEVFNTPQSRPDFFVSFFLS